MKKHLRFSLLLILLLIFNSGASAQTTIFGGRGLLRTQSAELVGANRLYVNTFFSAFMQQETAASSLTKDYGLAANFTLGLNRHVELIAHLKPYQDDQDNIWGAPGDTRLGLKIRTPFSNTSVHTALHFFANLPTGRDLNVNYEPYSSREIGVAGMALLTIDFMEMYSSFPLKWHLNLGYFDQNVHDHFFLNLEDQYLLATGLKFPIHSAVLFAEYSAEIFANNEFVNNYSANSQRLSQGIKVLGPWNLIYDFAFDISLSSHSEVTGATNAFHKQYADWKFIFGLNYPFSIQKKQPKIRRPEKLPLPRTATGEKASPRENYLESLQKIETALAHKSPGKQKTDDQLNENR